MNDRERTMNDRDPNITEEDLHAYVDGELAAERRGAVEAWLAAHPDDAGKVGPRRSQTGAIRGRYGTVGSEAPPERFDLARLARRRWRGPAIAAAAVVAAFLVGGGAGWFARGGEGGPPPRPRRDTTR